MTENSRTADTGGKGHQAVQYYPLPQRTYCSDQDRGSFFNYAIPGGLYNMLFPEKTGITGVQKTKRSDFQFPFSFWEEGG